MSASSVRDISVNEIIYLLGKKGEVIKSLPSNKLQNVLPNNF